MSDKAIFLDRDGVIVDDPINLIREDLIRVLPGVPQALAVLKSAGFRLIVVSNQPVVARGLVDPAEVHRIQGLIQRKLIRLGAPPLDGFYFCPHHPDANLPQYRIDCDCRKPKPGLILQAARDFRIDLSGSFLVGDRITDVLAGKQAGLRTVQVETGRHTDPPIRTLDEIELNTRPDFLCDSLASAVNWIV